jgi:hypothetical protein
VLVLEVLEVLGVLEVVEVVEVYHLHQVVEAVACSAPLQEAWEAVACHRLRPLLM